jgi:hypothetical protein
MIKLNLLLPALAGIALLLGASSLQTSFFPPMVFDPKDPEANAATDHHMSEQLGVFKVESLFNHKDDLETSALRYRMLWLASNCHPVCISLSKNGKSWSLHVMQHNGNPGNVEDNPKVVVDRTIELSAEESTEIEKLLDSAKLWGESKVDDTSGMTDGDLILFEAAKREKYSLRYRSGGSLNGLEKPLFKKLMELSGKDMHELWNDYRKGDNYKKDK